jgi:putative PIN family toxin of toxin-antitoxin system
MKASGGAKGERPLAKGALARRQPQPPRVVLDTNVVLSALLFVNGPVAGVRAGWQAARFAPLASTATAHELVRVLAYPKFRLSAAEQHELLSDVMPWMHVVEIPDPPPAVPACRDPHDAAFLHLAVAGKARALVSGDRDLLPLAGARGICPILSVEAFCRQYLE